MEIATQKLRHQVQVFGRVQGVMHYVNADALHEAYRRQKKGKAVGVDGVSKESYGANLDENISNLLVRMKRFQYKPKPVRRVYIKKDNGKLRPLGIPSFEDRLVQGAMAELLNAIYEPKFLDCSYGFRSGRSAHDAIRAIQGTMYRGKCRWVLEVDIKGFFDHVNHEYLMEFLKQDIDDSDFLRYIKRFLRSGVMDKEQVYYTEEGTPQGGLISPVLANVYLHYVLDVWMEKVVRPCMRGSMRYVRYADDFLILFEYKADAEKVMTVLGKRLGRYGLEVAVEKTRIIPFDKNKGTKDTFDFLGFTFYITKDRKGRNRPAVKTSKKKLKSKRRKMNEWLKSRMAKPIKETMLMLRRKLAGHEGYYAVNGNLEAVKAFWYYTQNRFFETMNRRGTKHKLTWEKVMRKWKYFIPEPRIRVQIWC